MTDTEVFRVTVDDSTVIGSTSGGSLKIEIEGGKRSQIGLRTEILCWEIMERMEERRYDVRSRFIDRRNGAIVFSDIQKSHKGKKPIPADMVNLARKVEEDLRDFADFRIDVSPTGKLSIVDLREQRRHAARRALPSREALRGVIGKGLLEAGADQASINLSLEKTMTAIENAARPSGEKLFLSYNGLRLAIETGLNETQSAPEEIATAVDLIMRKIVDLRRSAVSHRRN